VQQYSDVIVAHRVVRPRAVETWRNLKAAGKTLVMDFDDDYWHLNPEHAAYRPWNLPGVLDTLTATTRLADRVTCASTGLADVLSGIHPDVRVIPNGLHAAYLRAPRTYDSGDVRIGWAGTASTVTELHMIARYLNRVVDYTAGGTARVSAVYIGASPEALAAQGIDVEHPRVRSIEWVFRTEDYLRAVMGVDILVAPYRDNLFNAAKFPTKALECGMLGIPLIVSPTRPYREWAQDPDREHGIVLAEGHEWGRALRQLVEDPQLRAKVGRAGRARASRNILQDLGRVWEDALT
jgi:glycosyltransferase involved in cell wall biosynthesis